MTNSSPHHDAKCFCSMKLDSTLWEQMGTDVPPCNVRRILFHHCSKDCSEIRQKMQFVAIGYARHYVADPIEVGGVCDSARGEFYVEQALHSVHAAADGDELWN